MIETIFNRTVAISLIVFVVLSSMVLFVVALLIWMATVLFDRRLVILHRFTCFWAYLYLWIFPAWSVSVEGREKIDRDKTYIMVSNHQSLVDILVVFSLFTHFKWVSKNEVFRIPLIGWNMVLNRYVDWSEVSREASSRCTRNVTVTCSKAALSICFRRAPAPPPGSCGTSRRALLCWRKNTSYPS